MIGSKNKNSTDSTLIIVLGILFTLMIVGYSLARSCIESLFLDYQAPEDLPKAWLLVTLASAWVISVYNRYNMNLPLLTIYKISTGLSAGILALLLLLLQFKIPYVVFLLYAWKDIYIVLLVEIFWSFSDTVFSINKAQKYYGVFLGLSSLGGVFTHFSLGYLAKTLGTAHCLWILQLFFLLFFVMAQFISRIEGQKLAPVIKNKKQNWGDSWKVIRRSRYLVPLLFLVAILQIVIALIDYKYNVSMKAAYTNVDERTNIFGNINAIIDGFSLALQFAAVFILRLSGVAGALLAVPLMMGLCTFGSLVFPRALALIMGVKILAKSFDYSIFRVTKELLYIPLSPVEKIQGKGVIDIFVARLSRGFASFFLLFITNFYLVDYLMYLILGLIFAWSLLSFVIAQRYSSVVKLGHDVSESNRDSTSLNR